MSEGSRHAEGKSGGWSTTADMITQQAKAVTWQANFPESKYYTLQFGVEPPNQPTAAGRVWATIATILWKVEGNSVQRMVSVNNGVSISGTGQAMTVLLNDVTPDVGQPKGIPYKIGIQVSPGTRPSQNQPAVLALQSQADQSLAPASTETYLIPQNAGVISVEVVATSFDGGTETVPALEVRFISAAATFKSFSINNNYSGFIPVPPGATDISISNTSATDTAFTTVSWGIDG